VPLPPEMRVTEYLGYRAALKAIPRGKRRAAVDDAIGIAGLGERRTQIIGTLSRGYRQRVGLADAILARPPILILDEPTVGLDPNQIREVRELIRALAREQTVLLSTHILSEVEALNARVLILHRGRIAAARTPAELGAAGAGGARLVVEVRPAEETAARAALGALAGVNTIERLGVGRLALLLQGPPVAGGAGLAPAAADDADLRERVFHALVAAGLTLRELRWEASSLEELFARITAAPARGDADA